MANTEPSSHLPCRPFTSSRYLVLFCSLASPIRPFQGVVSSSPRDVIAICSGNQVNLQLPVSTWTKQHRWDLHRCLWSLPYPDEGDAVPPRGLVLARLDFWTDGVHHCPQHLILPPGVLPLSQGHGAAAQDVIQDAVCLTQRAGWCFCEALRMQVGQSRK